MPNPLVPEAIWEVAETAEMREVVGLYGKTFHFWQIDRGDELPLGMPELMMSFTKDEQVSGRKLCVWHTSELLFFTCNPATPSPGRRENHRLLREGLVLHLLTPQKVPWDKIKDRDTRFGIDSKKKKEARKDIPAALPHQDADSCWK